LCDDLDRHLNTINQSISSLSQGDNGPNCLLMTKLAESNLLNKRQSLEARLLQLNGKYYGDPDSLIHRAHCKGRLNKVEALIAEREQITKDLEKISEELKKIKSIQSFLKVIKIDVELVSLCGEFYGDAKGRLDQAWKAFQQRTGTQEQYKKLEERRNHLANKKITLQPLCADASVAMPEIAKIEAMQLCISERKETLKALAFVEGLKAWCDGICPEGRNARCFAAQTIFACYVHQSKCLELKQLGLTSVPAAIGQLIHLTKLELEHNALRDLPSEIEHLVNLKYLLLSSNQFQTMPSAICQLVRLKRLDLWANQLQTLPSEIGQLVNLKILYLSNNQLQHLPP